MATCKTNRRTLLASAVALGAGALARPAPAAQKAEPDVRDTLEGIRAKHDLPALATAVVLGGRTVAVAAVGVRKYGEQVPVTARDQFHIGSDTKSMTAT